VAQLGLARVQFGDKGTGMKALHLYCSAILMVCVLAVPSSPARSATIETYTTGSGQDVVLLSDEITTHHLDGSSARPQNLSSVPTPHPSGLRHRRQNVARLFTLAMNCRRVRTFRPLPPKARRPPRRTTTAAIRNGMAGYL
jgi:hypothetical protein